MNDIIDLVYDAYNNEIKETDIQPRIQEISDKMADLK